MIHYERVLFFLFIYLFSQGYFWSSESSDLKPKELETIFWAKEVKVFSYEGGVSSRIYAPRAKLFTQIKPDKQTILFEGGISFKRIEGVDKSEYNNRCNYVKKRNISISKRN